MTSTSAVELHPYEGADNATGAGESIQPRPSYERSSSHAEVATGTKSTKSPSAPPTEETETIVHINNVHKTYLLGIEGVPALRGVTLDVKRGEFVVILGKSGGGKSSMLNIIGTIDKPTKGEITVCGSRVTSKTKDAEFSRLRLRRIGFVFQTFNLISSMTAQENVELPMILDGRRTVAQRQQRAKKLLESVGMGNRVDHLPAQLSGGEQQRVTIARAVANKPDLLLLDEPTGDLDTHNSNIILSLLLDLNRNQGITLVMVTHDRSLKYFAHRVVHMVDGKIARLEVVPDSDRAAAEAKLTASMNSHDDGDDDAEPYVEIRDADQFYEFVKPEAE